MIDANSLNPHITHHIKPFRDRKLGRIESMDLRALVNEPCDANCVDVDNTRRLWL